MNFHRHRSNYWSCSNLANWLLYQFDIKKPGAETVYGWKLWKQNAIAKHPWIYTTVEDGFDKLQDIVYFPYDVYDNIRTYIRNRFITRTHLIDTRLIPGQWHETDERLLHGMMELLVDFVEIEKAHMYTWSSPDEEKPWYLRYRFLIWGENRSREKGLAYLDWEMQLTDDREHYFTQQALMAQEQNEIYIWWKDIRPNRPDAYEVTGWNAYYETHPKIEFFDENESDRTELRKLSNKVYKLEEDWNKEDEEMLQKLIKIRRSLWT